MPKQTQLHLDRKKSAQLNAHVGPVLARRLRIKLARDGINYKDWLIARIQEYAPRVRLPRQDQKV